VHSFGTFRLTVIGTATLTLSDTISNILCMEMSLGVTRADVLSVEGGRRRGGGDHALLTEGVDGEAEGTSSGSTRRRLQDAALDLFGRDGFDNVTVDAIAAAAGTSRRTFFRHFATKEDAAVADFDARVELFAKLLARERGSGRTAVEHVAEAGRTVVSTILAEPDFYRKRYRIVFANPALVDRMTLADRRYEELIAEAVSEDFPGELGVLHARMFAAAAIALTNVVFERWVADPGMDPGPLIANGIAELGRAATSWQSQGGPATS
jgi:TetR/AcrR family transcriptional regulator, regulator of mycofactocin system